MWFTNVVKPTHICNLACTYCYNEDSRSPKMTHSVLERVVEQTLTYANKLDGAPKVDFIWHGGEPTVAGIDFYRAALNFQRSYRGNARFANSIQTNGTKIDDQWIAFFKESEFDVSLSIDGPRDVNDRTRRHGNGQGSFDQVMRGITKLRTAGIPCGVCVVISQSNKNSIGELFDFLSEEKLPFNVIPLTRSGAALDGFCDLGIGSGEYAEPWIELFDRWFDSDPSRYVQCTDFVRKSRAILIGRPTDCIGQAQCATHHISTDPDGNVFPCATLSSDPDWCYGNLILDSMESLLSNSVAKLAVNREVDEHCSRCKWQHVCHGGCMSRSIKFYGTHNTRDYYCESLYRIYDHIEMRLRESSTSLDLSCLPSESYLDTRPPPGARDELTMRRQQYKRIFPPKQHRAMSTNKES